MAIDSSREGSSRWASAGPSSASMQPPAAQYAAHDDSVLVERENKAWSPAEVDEYSEEYRLFPGTGSGRGSADVGTHAPPSVRMSYDTAMLGVGQGARAAAHMALLAVTCICCKAFATVHNPLRQLSITIPHVWRCRIRKVPARGSQMLPHSCTLLLKWCCVVYTPQS